MCQKFPHTVKKCFQNKRPNSMGRIWFFVSEYLSWNFLNSIRTLKICDHAVSRFVCLNSFICKRWYKRRTHHFSNLIYDRSQLFKLTFPFFSFRFNSKVPSESKPFKPENTLLLVFLLFTPASV